MCNMCARDVVDVQAPPQQAKKPSAMIERMKRKHNIVTDPSSSEIQKKVEYIPDLLTVSTQYSKVAFDLVKQTLVRLQETKAYVVATRTSQPIHVALGILVLFAWLSSPGSNSNVRGWTALYVGAVATHLGAQVWMTLVSGIVLYFSLPRHEFGRVQTVLFPVYYAFNATISLLALLSYYRTQCLTQFQNTSWVQLALLLAVFSIEAYVRLRLVRPMLRAKHVKTQMEEAAGNGSEVMTFNRKHSKSAKVAVKQVTTNDVLKSITPHVIRVVGRLVLGELAHCPRYLRVLKTFRTYHSSIAMGTMITLGCSLYSTMIIVDSMCR